MLSVGGLISSEEVGVGKSREEKTSIAADFVDVDDNLRRVG